MRNSRGGCDRTIEGEKTKETAKKQKRKDEESEIENTANLYEDKKCKTQGTTQRGQRITGREEEGHDGAGV